MSSFSYKRFIGLVLGWCLLGSLAASAQSASYAILIVGDESNAEMLRQEKVLIGAMAKTIRKQSPDQKLSIYSYHFNKERERVYCEQRLNVLKEDLLFVGVVRLDETVPRKVVYRIDRINNPTRAADDVLARAEELRTETVATPAPAPAPSETPAPPTAAGWRIQLGSFTQLKYAEERVLELEELGYAATIDKGEQADNPMFKVTVGPFETREALDTALTELKTKGFEQAFAVETKPQDGE